MFKFIYFFILLLILLDQSTSSFSLRDPNPLDLIELALNEQIISVDELFDENQSKFGKIKRKSFFDLFHNEPDFNFNAQQMIEYRGFKVNLK